MPTAKNATGGVNPTSGTASGPFPIPASGTGTTGVAPVVGDLLDLFLVNTGPFPTLTPPTGWTIVAQATMGTGAWMHLRRTGGWQTADGTSVTFTFGGTVNVEYAMVLQDQTVYSGYGTNGTVTTRPASPTTTVTTAVATGSGDCDMAVVSFDKAATHTGTPPTVPTVSPTTTPVAWYASTGASQGSVYVGMYTATGAAADRTLTYSTASGNGAAFQVAMVPAATGTPATAVGSVTLGATVLTQAPVAATGSLTLAGMATGPGVSAAGSLSLAGTVTGGAAAGATGSLTLLGSASAAAPVLKRTMLGIPDTTAVRATALTLNAISARLAVSTTSGMTLPVFSTSTTPDAQGYATNLTVTGLTAGTDYWYQVELNGVLMGSAVKTSTLPTGPAEFSIGFGSCVAVLGTFSSGVNPIVFNAIKNRPSVTGKAGPEEFWHLGDLSYPNNSGSPNGDYITDDPTVVRANYEAGIASNLASLMASVPSAHQRSDNDSGGGNSDAGSGAWPALTNGTDVTVLKQIMAYPTLSDTSAMYHAHMRGRVLIITIDDRTYSSGATTTDNSSKTKLGATQRTWLLGQLSGAKAAGAAAVIIMADDDWRDTGGTSPSADAGLPAQNDGWGAYGTERTTIAAGITSVGIPVLWCNGDSHSLSLDNGTHNSHGGFATFTAAPFLQTANSYTGGGLATSNGGYPTSDMANQSYYGWIDVTDDGTTLTLTCTAYDSTASGGLYASDVVRGTPMVITSTTAAAAGGLTLGGSVSAKAPVVAIGSLSLGASIAAKAPVTATGSIALTGTASTTVPITAVGSITLTATSGASGTAPATATASIALSGSATAGFPGGATGSISLTGTVAAGAHTAAAGSLALVGTVTVGTRITATGALTLTATASTPTPATASGSITLSATATAHDNSGQRDLTVTVTLAPQTQRYTVVLATQPEAS